MKLYLDHFRYLVDDLHARAVDTAYAHATEYGYLSSVIVAHTPGRECCQIEPSMVTLLRLQVGHRGHLVPVRREARGGGERER